MKIENTNTTASGRSSKAGFTLVEIMISVVVLGLLATLIVVNAPAVFSAIRVNSVTSDYKLEIAAVADAAAKCGGTLPITEAGASIVGLTTGTNLATSQPADFYNNARLEQVLLGVPDPLFTKYITPSYGSQNFARADRGLTGDLTYDPSTGMWSNAGDVAITSTMSYANNTRLECAAIDASSLPGTNGRNFRLTAAGTDLIAGGRVAYKVIRGMPGKEAYKVALKLNGNGLMTDGSQAATAAQTNGVCTYAGSTTGITDVYIFLAQF